MVSGFGDMFVSHTNNKSVSIFDACPDAPGYTERCPVMGRTQNKKTFIMDIAFVVGNLSQHSAHSLSLSGDTLVALEDRVLDFEKQKGLNFTKFSPVL